jgi:hypothetical protein
LENLAVGQVDFGRLMMNIRAEEQKAGRRCRVATGISTKKKISGWGFGNMFYDFPFSWEWNNHPN